MKIGIDLRVLARGARTGVEEYTINITRSLIEQYPQVEFRLFYNAWRKVPIEFPWVRRQNVRIIERRFPNRLIDASAQLVGIPKLDRLVGNVDVFFSPHFLWTSLAEAKRVVTVHDLSFARFPDFFSFRKLFWHHSLRPRAQLERAHRIIAVSQSTKNDLVRLWGIPEDKISIVHEGVDHDLFRRPSRQTIAEYRAKHHLPQKFLLFMGTIEPRKNLVSLLGAFSSLRRSGGMNDWELVICGSRGWLWQPVFREIANLGLDRSVRFLTCSSEDRPLLYSAASMFVFPSYFEGFGLPALEAMACGTPVITSNRSSLPEVVGNAAVMIDPWREFELKEAMSRLITNKSLRQLLVKRGQAQAKKFDWEKAAGETFKIFQHVRIQKSAGA